MLGNPVLLRLFGVLELDSTLVASFIISAPFVSGPSLRFEPSLVLPLAVPTREPAGLVFGLLLVGGVQDRQALRVSHVTGLADSERLSARAGVIGRQTDEVVGRVVSQAEAATRTLGLATAGTGRAGAVAARSRRRSQVVPGVQTTLQIADQRLPADDARRGQVRQRIVQSLLRIHVLQAVPLNVLQELTLRGETTATDHAGVAQLDLAVLLELVLGQGRAGRAHFVANVALVTSTGLVGRVLDPGM